MTVYRLEPILPDHATWSKSSHKGPLWVNADSEKDARGKVAEETDMAAVVGYGTIPKLRSPWDLAEVTSCVPDDSRKITLGGGVMTADGTYLSIDLD